MEDKFDKKTLCLYCKKEMQSKYRSKKFCSDKCRVYFSRENKVAVEIIGEQKVFVPKNQPVLDKFGKILVSEGEVKKETKPIEETMKQFPLREPPPRLKGESSIDYRIRMSE